MKKVLLFVAFVLLNMGTIFAQENQSVLWEISGKGLEKPSYLFGTVHIASISLLDSFPQLMRIAVSCDFSIFESGGLHIGNVPTCTETSQPPLDSLFTPKEYAIVDSFFTASPHGSIRPHNNDADLWTMLQAALAIQEGGSNIQYDPFDHLLHYKLNGINKTIFQLDNPEEIDSTINSFGYRNLAQLLVHAIKEKAAFRQLAPPDAKDIDLYSRTLRNPLKLEEVVGKNLANVTIERNAHWLPKIKEKVQERGCFIAVGLGHLKFQTGAHSTTKKRGVHIKAGQSLKHL